jgi:hypothetical protein
MFRISQVHPQERLLQAVRADLVCGNTRTTRYTMSSRYGVVGRTAFFLQHRNGRKHRAVRVLPLTNTLIQLKRRS